MILNIDVTGKDFVVTKEPWAKADQQGQQRLEKGTDLPMWSTQLVVTDTDGGEIIQVTTVGDKPDLVPGDEVEVKGLIAFPWTSNGRNGITYRANSIEVVDGI